jgi:hypothetical protein
MLHQSNVTTAVTQSATSAAANLDATASVARRTTPTSYQINNK